VAACRNCGAENPDRAKFCLECGTPVVAATEERRVITALFTDIVGSTATAEQLDPEDVRARLAPYYPGHVASSSGTAEPWRSSSATP
jgi:hypothetical protein